MSQPAGRMNGTGTPVAKRIAGLDGGVLGRRRSPPFLSQFVAPVLSQRVGRLVARQRLPVARAEQRDPPGRQPFAVLPAFDELDGVAALDVEHRAGDDADRVGRRRQHAQEAQQERLQPVEGRRPGALGALRQVKEQVADAALGGIQELARPVGARR
jgi:hypothetical protein